LAEFAYNNAQHSSTQLSPFYANYGFNPRCQLKVLNEQGTPVHPIAEGFVEKHRAIYKRITENLKQAQAKYKEFYDAKHKESPPFKVGDRVWLSRRNITTTRPSAKLDFKRLGPFTILEVIGESKLAFKLDLPPSMKIHPVFHASLLTPYRANTFPGRVQPPPPPVVVDGEEEWEVKEVLDSRIRYNKLEYFVSWEGFGPDSNGWEPAVHLENSPDKVALFHARHPNRPSPTDLPSSRNPGRKDKSRKVSQELNP
jgi:Chromo (CHRromatin Organisation MOdifier) domain